ncbi:hypothetical protein ACLOJK_037651 [Asimina triloba]
MPTIHLLLLLLFSCSTAHVLVANGQQGRDEPAVLLSIKAGLIDPLGHLHDWNKHSSHCTWTGVSCNAAGGVEALDLSHMNLSGLISNTIQHLPSLSFLNISFNAFTTSLPTSLSNLTSLRILDISQNAFVGAFPPGLYRPPGLLSINASGNNLQDSLPDSLANATSLESLDLRGNFFHGAIPAAYKNLQKLKFLGLSGNNLTGRIPGELGQLSSLETAIIGYNAFQGSIPPEFGNLTNLSYLDVVYGGLEGKIPPELGKLRKLRTIFLFKNSHEGEIPAEIGNISSLVELDLSDNSLSGAIPAELAQLKNLQLLSLFCNRFSGPIPPGIGELNGLKVVEIWNNSFSGELPDNLGRHSPLQSLDVSSNSFTGSIPSGLCDGGNLTKLILFNNSFSGAIPIGLSSCRSLVRVRIQENRISGTIPVGFGSLPELRWLELASNGLWGPIPGDFALSTSLEFIDLSRNHLQSSLPYSILSIPHLQSFTASDNNLTGEIPDQFQDCPALAVLDLSNNELPGGIPASLASCEKLVTLDLHSNRLEGEIPTAIASMPMLAVLDLSSNMLTGALPEDFGASPALETLNVSYNKLAGPIPTNGMLRTINPDELAGNPGLCGGVLGPCSMDSSFRAASSTRRRVHIKHLLGGWAAGISIVLFLSISTVGGRWLYSRWRSRIEAESGEWPWRLTAFQRLNFTTADIVACIKESNVIGMGGAGIVYRAEVQRPHSVVAVKKLWREAEAEAESCEGEDFVGEVNLLGRLRHRNIVRLLGYLQKETEMMMVYEYMANGSLWEALHGGRMVLVDWVARYKVGVGVAQGLAYLHHDCNPPVLHRDVKSNNILLDGNLDARIADFGLAIMMIRKKQTVSAVAGSYGYIAPEYGYTMKVDQKTDIYSFGVVLLELVTGKRPLEPEFGDCVDIVEWVRWKIRNTNSGVDALDPSMGPQCKHVQEEMMLVLRIALACTARYPKDRPPMRDVLTMLGEAKPRRKSSSGSSNDVKDKPVFTSSPVSGLL